MTNYNSSTQAPLPMGVSVLLPQPRRASIETIEALQQLLTQANNGKVTGLAVLGLHSDGRFELHITGDATNESNQMGVVGMLAALQKMALELH